MAVNSNEERIIDLEKGDAGYSFLSAPYVEPDLDNQENTYEEIRGDDKIETVLQNDSNLQFTEQVQDDYLRLLMPKYTRRVEVEDLNRNFWVIGQTLNYLSRHFSLDDKKEKFRFEITLEKDRDNHDYSNYPHKIVFNEGVGGIRTPYAVKDYCYRSNELNDTFEDEAIWYRQVGGFNAADEAYVVGGGGAVPFLNFYKPRPDAIPIFTLTQTESSDIESFNAGDNYKKWVKKDDEHTFDDTSYHNYLGRTSTFLLDGEEGEELISENPDVYGTKIKLNGLPVSGYRPEPGTEITLTNSDYGQIVSAKLPELSPIKVHGYYNGSDGYKDTYDNDLTHIKADASVVLYSTGVKISFEQFSEGQMIYFEQDSNETKNDSPVKNYNVDGWYVKSYNGSVPKHGYVFPSGYCWKKIVASKPSDDDRAIDVHTNAGSLCVNFTEQKLMWNKGKWHNLDMISLRDGPTTPQYQVVENGSMFRVLGDSSIEIEENSTTTPVINGVPFSIPLRPHDVVRYIDPLDTSNPSGTCFEWWDGKWRTIHNCDAAYVNIFIWFPQKTSTLRSVFHWTLKWLIPPGIGEYN